MKARLVSCCLAAALGGCGIHAYVPRYVARGELTVRGDDYGVQFYGVQPAGFSLLVHEGVSPRVFATGVGTTAAALGSVTLRHRSLGHAIDSMNYYNDQVGSLGATCEDLRYARPHAFPDKPRDGDAREP